jgi:predicted solute-binding protein
MVSSNVWKTESVATISVALHKTAGTYGPAHIAVTSEVRTAVVSLFKLGIKKKKALSNEVMARADRGAKMMFVTSQGLSVTSSEINRYL